MREGATLLCCCLAVIAFTAGHCQLSTLRKIQVVFRHGIRYPTILMWNDSCVQSYDEYHIGNLTQKGKDQMIQLGNILRSRYDGLIGPDASVVKALYSDFHRDLESAELVSQGLFQAFNTSAVEVVKLDREVEGAMLWNRSYIPYWINSVYFKDEYQDLCERLDGLEGVQCKGLMDVLFIADQMLCELIEGCDLPAWLDREMQQQFDQLFEGIAKDNKLCTRRSHVEKNSDLLVAMMNDFFGSDSGEDHKKAHLYALHDMNVDLLRTRMGVRDADPPCFGSVLFFELHVLGDGSSVVRVFHDNTLDYTGLHQLKMADCDLDCPLADYLRIISGPNLCYRLDIQCSRTTRCLP